MSIDFWGAVALIGMAVAFDSTGGAAAAEDDPLQHECDRQAAYLGDGARAAEPVPFERIDAKKAVAACLDALNAYPDTARFQLQLARAYEKAGRVGEAIELLQEAAASGYAGAQSSLGTRYWHGDGVPQNYDEAVTLLRPSAEQGNGYSQALLATSYLQGSGVEQDVEEAKRWIERSADQGNERGRQLLAMLYEHGVGVPRDVAKARRLYTQSAEGYAGLVQRGFVSVADDLSSIATHLFEQPYQSVDDIDIGQVRSWIERLAEDGHAEAQYTLGRMYERGYATPRYRGTPDLDSAYAWFRRAAANGAEAAYERLLRDYSYRLALGPDYQPVIASDRGGRPLEEAKTWLRQTAEVGRAESQLLLGLAYHHGYSFEADLEAARFWYGKAAAQGNDEARQLLEEVQVKIDQSQEQ